MRLLHSRRLNDQELDEFRRILKKTTGHDFSLDEAGTLADSLFNALAVIRDVVVEEELRKDGRTEGN